MNQPWQRFCFGRGARPVRAGSIGWDIPVHGVLTELPPEEAEGVSPALSTEKSAPHGSKRTGLASRPWASLAFTPSLSSSDLGPPPVAEGLWLSVFRGLKILHGRLGPQRSSLAANRRDRRQGSQDQDDHRNRPGH